MSDVYIEKGELRRMRDPRTGQLKDVDLSLSALSETMENIRKSAEIINNKSTNFTIAVARFNYIEELVLDHAQFSPKLANLQIKIFDKTLEIVKQIDELQEIKINFIRNYFIDSCNKELARIKPTTSDEMRKYTYIKAQDIVDKGIRRFLNDDHQLQELYKKLQSDIEQI